MNNLVEFSVISEFIIRTVDNKEAKVSLIFDEIYKDYCIRISTFSGPLAEKQGLTYEEADIIFDKTVSAIKNVVKDWNKEREAIS